jgi:hypothetical protein
MESPAMILVIKKNTGKYEEYHSGWSLDGAIRKSAPRED